MSAPAMEESSEFIEEVADPDAEGRSTSQGWKLVRFELEEGEDQPERDPEPRS